MGCSVCGTAAFRNRHTTRGVSFSAQSFSQAQPTPEVRVRGGRAALLSSSPPLIRSKPGAKTRHHRSKRDSFYLCVFVFAGDSLLPSWCPLNTQSDPRLPVRLVRSRHCARGSCAAPDARFFILDFSSRRKT